MGADPRTPVYARIDSDFSQHVENVMNMVSQPSVSQTGEGITEMAEQLCQRLRALGADVRAVPTGGHPIVYGLWDVGAPRTVLFYILYDVQPATPAGWIVPPFEPAIVDLPDLGPSIVGRGTINSKGSLCAFINVLETMVACGQRPPVNIRFMIEGEEELGSPSLPAFIREHADELKACDAVFQPFTGQNSAGQPLVYMGSKGLIYLELTCQGGEWGGPVNREIHAMHNAWIGSPGWRLVQALATLKEPGPLERTAVAGWYDDVAPPTPAQERLLEQLNERFRPEVLLRDQDTLRFKLPPETPPGELVRHYLWEPSLNLDGIWGGYTGPGSKTVMPNQVSVKLDIRPVPNMDPEKVLQLLRCHLDSHGFADIAMRVLSRYPWSQSDPESMASRALLDGMAEHCSEPIAVWPRHSGVVPHYLFTRELGLPVAFGGLGHGGRAHSVNEYITVEGLRLHEKAIAAFLYNFAQYE